MHSGLAYEHIPCGKYGDFNILQCNPTNRGVTSIFGVRDFAVYIPYIRVRGYPLNGIFGCCACLLVVAVGRGGCWLVVAATAAAIGVILSVCLIRGTWQLPY